MPPPAGAAASAKKAASPATALSPFDQVVAADVVLQVAAQESGVRRQPGGEFRFELTAGNQSAVQAAP